MVNFVERATLIVDGKSDREIRKINRELKELRKNANAVEKAVRKIKFDGLSKGASQAQKLTAELVKASRATGNLGKPVNFKLNTGNASSKLQRLVQQKNQLARPTRLNLNTSGASQKLRQLQAQKAALAKSASFAVNGGVTGGNRDGRQTMHLVPNANQFGSRFGSAFLSTATHQFASAVQHAVVRGLSTGLTKADTSETHLRKLDLTEDQISQVSNISKKLSAQNPTFSRSDLQGVMGEAIAVAKGNISAAEKLAGPIAQLATARVADGEDRDKAITSATLYARTAESAGWAFDDNGNFDEKRFREFAGSAYRAGAVGGKEITPNLTRDTFKSLRASKYALGERAILGSMLMAEEVGSTAGVGLNQLSTNLVLGKATKQALNAQARHDLTGPVRQEKIGTVGGKTSTVIRSGGLKDRELFDKNPFAWVREHVIPSMNRAGLDPNNASDVKKYAGEVASHKSAVDALINLTLRAEDYRKSIDAGMKIGISPEKLSAIAAQSSNVSRANASAQFESSLGQAANALEGVLIPALNSTSGVLQGLANTFAGDDGKGDPVAVAKAAIAGVGLAAGGVSVAGKLTEKMGLRGSAVALNGSADNLNSAASAIKGAARGKASDKTGTKSSSKRNSGSSNILGSLVGTATLAVGGRAIVDSADTLIETLKDPKKGSQSRIEKLENRRNSLVDLAKQSPVQGDLIAGLIRNYFDSQIDLGKRELAFLNGDKTGKGQKELAEARRIILNSQNHKSSDLTASNALDAEARRLNRELGPTPDALQQIAGLRRQGNAIPVEAVQQPSQQLAFNGQPGSSNPIQFAQAANPIVTAFGAEVDQAQAAGQQVSAAATALQAAGPTVAGEVRNALADGGAGLAGQIRGALAAGVTVNNSPQTNLGATNAAGS